MSSEPRTENPVAAEEDLPWKALLVGLAGILLFVGILAVAYVPTSDPLVQVQLEENRAQEVRQKGKELDSALQSYGWVNEQNGVIRIPIERAMDLQVARARQSQLSQE